MSDPHDTGASASPRYTVPTSFSPDDAQFCLESAQPDLEDVYATARGLAKYMVHCDAPQDHEFVASTLRLLAFGIASLAVRFDDVPGPDERRTAQMTEGPVDETITP